MSRPVRAGEHPPAPERFVLSVLGIALAIACVTVVRTISSSFAITGADSVTDVLDGAQLWAVPAAGVHYDPGARRSSPTGPRRPSPSPTAGGHPHLSGPTGQRDARVAARHDESPTAKRLSGSGWPTASASPGRPLVFGGQTCSSRSTGDGQCIDGRQSDLARSVVGENGWWTVFAPPGDEKRRDLGRPSAPPSACPTTTDPSVAPDAAGDGLIYDTVGGSGPPTFEQKFSALFSGKVTSSTLGLISTIGLVLGFVIAVSSFLAAVQERSREFGIMASIGLADEVLYFFLVESAHRLPLRLAARRRLRGSRVAWSSRGSPPRWPGCRRPGRSPPSCPRWRSSAPSSRSTGCCSSGRSISWGTADALRARGLAYGLALRPPSRRRDGAARRDDGDRRVPRRARVRHVRGIRAQSASLGHADEIGRAVVLIAVTVLLVGVVEVAVSTTRTVVHRTSELGVLGATGVPRPPVVAALLVEPVIAAVLGAVAGSALAAGVTAVLGATGCGRPGSPPAAWRRASSIAVVVSAVAALATSILPTWRAASRPPIRSLSTGG